MARAKQRDGEAKQARRWCIPPVLLQRPGETLEGMSLLEEDPTETGVLLWTCLRDIMLWASVDPADRDDLFPAGAAARLLDRIRGVAPDRELEIALTTLGAVLDVPATVNPQIVALVCHAIGRWAEERGRLATAVAFKVAAAASVPGSGGPAREVARVAVRLDELPWAETWARRALTLSRRAREWEVYGLALLDLAEISLRRRTTTRAERYFRASVRAGRRFGLAEVRAAGLHGLARLLAEDADYLRDAEKYAGMALRAYGRGHARVPVVMRDLARIWVTAGMYARAVPVLRKYANATDSPDWRISMLALLARAAAGGRDGALYESTWSAAWTTIDSAGADVQEEALMELARAAALSRDGRYFTQAESRHRSMPQADHRNRAELQRLAASLASRRAG